MKDRKDLIKSMGIHGNKKDPFESLAKQCQAEYLLAWKHQKPKKDEWEVRLKLLNNQKRDKKAVGDTTMFTIHQTVLASLYSDRLESIWGAKEAGDEEVAENLNALAENDYDDMEKDIVDYDWDWDTLFFGRGLISFEEYERDPDNNLYLPVPYVLDPIPFLRDPFAVSVNGDRRNRGAARFYGYELKMTKYEMEESPHIFDDIAFSQIKFGSGTQSILQDAIAARQEAQGHQGVLEMEKEAALGSNAQYSITQWHTHYEINNEIKKIRVWLANDRTKVIGVEILDKDYWRVIDRPLYPTSHDWDGTSIPDLTEDKQRARAVAQNLGLEIMKSDAQPMYIYDSNKITNRKDLSFKFNKFLPVDGKDQPLGNAIMPMLKARPNLQLMDFIMNSLDISAQKATATSDIKQGIQSQKDRPLGETNLLQGNTDTRYSLSAKVFGWSERRFWREWYQIYKDNLKEDIDKKTLRLVGAFGAKWRPLGRENIIAKIDPDVKIESRVMNRAKQIEERIALAEYFSLALQEPTANRRWGLKKLGSLNGLKKDEIERLFPPTIDERIAEGENELLNKNELVQINREDDHNIHLEMHSKAADTPAAKAHIEAHKKALSIKKISPELFPEDPMAADFQPPGTKNINTNGSAGSRMAPIRPSQTSMMN